MSQLLLLDDVLLFVLSCGRQDNDLSAVYTQSLSGIIWHAMTMMFQTKKHAVIRM